MYDIKNKIEIEEKDRSIIMFNHPESTKTNSSERKKDDIEFVHRFKFQNSQFSLVSDLVDIPKIKLDLSRLFFCYKVGQFTYIYCLQASSHKRQ